MSQWSDEHRNVLTRDVFRPAAVSRYFMTFNFVDIHDQRRQHELGLETKWVAKGEDAGEVSHPYDHQGDMRHRHNACCAVAQSC